MNRRALLASLTALALAACGKKSGQAKTEDGNTVGQSAEVKPDAAGQAYLDKNAKEPGVKTTASGLQYKIVRANPTGQVPKLGDEVKVNYEGTLVDGSVFDSSYKTGQPVIFPVGGLIEGWNEALQMMHVGEEWILAVPPKLGYGDSEKPGIPANSVLVFRLELLAMLSKPNANV